MKEDTFYTMLAELHTAISHEACGCMGSQYTKDRVRAEDADGRDYLGSILRKYIGEIK